MVNWVQVLREHGQARLAKIAGLRQHAVAIHDQDDADAAGTVINFWLPKHHKKKHTSKEGPGGKKTKKKQSRHAVVLVHGFAGDGIMTWWPQLNALARVSHVDVYVPDLVHFGGSTSPSRDRSATFQARCLAAALRKLGVVERCTVVGFSYGGLVAFEMAAAFPELVRSIVVSGAVPAYTAAMNDALLGRFGVGSLAELMLPDSVGGVMVLFSTAFYKKPWLPRRLLGDFLELMCNNREERAGMLEDTIIRDKEAPASHVFQQSILLLWGENDNFFTIEGAKRLKEELGEKATLRNIRKAGHLAHIERPCVYNRCLKEFLAHVNTM
ncbi:uncharacterized protein LOC124656228 [Lolium rigidum]|uniref:uncharacterized protein LOC124656228 n=1 Tax=Lolium rigidum TaxID=89674 RepID=UPI001F5DB5AF|nr:uncharacterized protein LOC124656228 [Lolium rigidum]